MIIEFNAAVLTQNVADGRDARRKTQDARRRTQDGGAMGVRENYKRGTGKVSLYSSVFKNSKIAVKCLKHHAERDWVWGMSK